MLLSSRQPTYMDDVERIKPPRLYLEEDEAFDRYRISTYGGPATASMLTLSEWRPIELPTHLIDSAQSPSLDRGSSAVHIQKAPFQDNAGRFRAWIKKSGKRLVIRLRGGTRTKAQGFTDIHMSYDEPELERKAVLHSPQDFWALNGVSSGTCSSPFGQDYKAYSLEELPDSSISEIPDSPLRTELPTGRNYPELLVEAGNVTLGRDQIPNLIQCDRFPTGGALSPAGTMRSNLSSADTAVDSDSVAERKAYMHHSSTVARGLSILGSIKYRCKPDGPLSNASPTELVNLASLETMDFSPNECVYADDLEKHPQEPRMAKHYGILEGLKPDSLLGVSSADNARNGLQRRLLTRQRGHFMHSVYGPSSNRLMYQQDLHFDTTNVQTENIALETSGAEDRIVQKIERLLQKALTASTTSNSEICSARGSGNAQGNPRTSNIGSLVMAQVPIVEQHSVTDGDPEVGDFVYEVDHKSSHTGRSSAVTTTESGPSCDADTLGKDSSARSTDSPDKKDEVNVTALSPISPLTKEEQGQHQTSITSQIDLVTPITPKLPRMNEIEIDIVDHEVSENDSFTSPPPSASDSCDNVYASSSAIQSPTPVRIIEDIGSKTGKAGFLADFVDYKPPSVPTEATPIAPLGYLTDDKIPARYKNTRIKTPVPQIDTTVADRSPPTVISPSFKDEDFVQSEYLLHTGRAEPQQTGNVTKFYNLVLRAVSGVALRSILWLQRHAEQEPSVPEGRVRVRWRCSCGESLYDDFFELRPGAASVLEAQLNNVAIQPYSMPMSSSRSSSATLGYTPNSASQPSSSATSLSSASGFGTPSGNAFRKSRLETDHSTSQENNIYPYQGPRYLLTCISEARNTPKLSQIPLHKANIRSDKDLAIALRDHYHLANQSWYRKLRLRGLTSIEFVEFYKHCNSFADIRKCPGVPPAGCPHDYEFYPSAVLPPVGPHYLVHLFKHPHEYEDEGIAYNSIPKKTSKLHGGIGWGIQLTEGFLPERIWVFIITTVMLFGCVFALVWSIREHDIQGAFGVASFVTTLVSMVFGFVQACLG